MSEETEFKIKLAADWWRMPPHVIVTLNDEVIDDFRLTEKHKEGNVKEIVFKRSLVPDEYTIGIRLLDKDMPETQVDDKGNILNDQLLNILSIEIDEIELDYLLITLGKFYPDNFESRSLPEEIDGLLNIGYNGIYKMKIKVPTYLWFLENL